MMKLEKIYQIKGQIKLLTGLHIGGNKDNIEIGGMDQPIIKIPVVYDSEYSGQPYIPGSSLKGKMRSMLEITFCPENIMDGKPCGCGECNVCKIFGTANDNKPEELGPTRILVRDAQLTNKWQELFKNGDLPLEEKYENIIDRIKGTAKHPRPLERVPAGVEFDFSISLKQMEGDNNELLSFVWKGLRLIELDGLGGGISRGSGQVKFLNVTLDDEPQDDKISAEIIWE